LLIVEDGRWKGMDYTINQISRLIDWSEPCAPAFLFRFDFGRE